MVNSILNPQPEPGLTNALFQSWFGSFGIPGASTGTYAWNVTDVNTSGVAIGQVSDVGILIDTAFIFAGALICCNSDELRLHDINDNGFVVGALTFSGIVDNGFVAYCCGSVNDGQSAIPLTFNPSFYNLTGFNNFLGIDDSNKILATTVDGQHYELDPTPEPASIVLIATVFGLTAFPMLRRRISRLRNGRIAA